MTRQLPFVSVVVATYRRPAALARCLESLASADYPKDHYEVVVVDDGGGVTLDDVFGRFDGSLALRALRQENAGAAAARNRGAAAARGDVLVFTDDDCVARPGWIRALVEATERCPDSLIGGRTENALPANVFSSASQLLIDGLCTPRGIRGAPFFLGGNNLAVPKHVFSSVGGFDPTFSSSAGEDRELSARFQALGRPFVFAPNAVIRHVHPLTLRSFLEQHFNYGRAAFRFRTHRRSHGASVRLEGPRFYLSLLLLPLQSTAACGWLRAAALCLLLGIAQVATSAGFAAEWLSPRILRARG